MKKISALLICMLMLVSCNDIEYDVDYPVKMYDIENAVDGVYNVELQSEKNASDTTFRIDIKKSDNVIYQYSFYDNGKKKCPEKIVKLFNYNNGVVYYIQNYVSENNDENQSDEPLCFLVYYGEKNLYFMDYNNCLQINVDKYDNISDYVDEQLVYASEFLQENTTEQEITDIFNKCGYGSTYILDIYGYKK